MMESSLILYLRPLFLSLNSPIPQLSPLESKESMLEIERPLYLGIIGTGRRQEGHYRQRKHPGVKGTTIMLHMKH